MRRPSEFERITEETLSITRVVLTTAIGVSIAPAVAVGQEEVPPAPAAPVVEAVGFGEAVSGILTYADLVFQDSSRFKPYMFNGDQGQEITLHLTSSDFNAIVLLADSTEQPFLSDENSGGSCNAYLTTTLPYTGRYMIFVNATLPGEIGQYRLTLQLGKQAAEGDSPCRGFIELQGRLWTGDAVESELTTNDGAIGGAFFEAWLLPNTDGEPITVDLISDAFDAGLILVQGFAEVLDVNDDGAGGCNARIAHRPTSSRPLRVVARAMSPGATGKYTLRVKPGLEPLVDQPPCQRGGDGP
ncbi:MAG TPA: hypothetical protein VGA22_06215 [Gemmatimonadales bacterium]